MSHKKSNQAIIQIQIIFNFSAISPQKIDQIIIEVIKKIFAIPFTFVSPNQVSWICHAIKIFLKTHQSQ